MLGHYRLVESVGEGGMGLVWKALDTKLNRHVALKLLPPLLTSDPERRLRFQREAQAAAALDHPNIAVIYEVGEHDGTPFIAMQLLEGRTLREVIGGRSLRLEEWLRLGLPIAEGLAHAHKNGIVHRDLKPGNVIVTGDGHVKLLSTARGRRTSRPKTFTPGSIRSAVS
jgi:serine/threonine protein kinase